MALNHALLALSAEKPRYPYAMKAAFEEVFGEFWPLNYGQVHQSLETMRKKGLLTVQPDPDDASRKLYAITPEGEAELARWEAEGADVKVRALRDDLYLRLWLLGRDAGTPPEHLLGLVEDHRLAWARQLRRLVAQREEASAAADPNDTALPTEILLVEAAIEHADAEIRWLDRVRDELESRMNPDAAHTPVPRRRRTDRLAHVRRTGTDV